MATRDGGSASSQHAIERSSYSDSESSYAGSGHSGPHDGAVCQYRNARFYDQECSRYWDCPTHVVERILSDGEDEQNAEINRRYRAIVDGEERRSLATQGVVHHTNAPIVPAVVGGGEQDPFPNTPSAEHPSNAYVERPSVEEVVGVQAGPSRTPLSPMSALLGLGDEQPSPYEGGIHPSLRARMPIDGLGDERPSPYEGAIHPSLRVRTPVEDLGIGSSSNPIILPDSPPSISRSEGLRDIGQWPVGTRNNSGGALGGPSSSRLPAIGAIGASSGQSISPGQVGFGGSQIQTSTLVGPGPPLPTTNEHGELLLPRWQPDAEVTYCPICHAQFSIFVRKHHCRKCGRVVCNACSPHRITIPYQYIVQPPGTPQVLAPRYPSALGSGIDFTVLGGGEKVRLCNPCVPDPNITPPQTQGGHSRSQSTLLQPPPEDNNLFPFRWAHYWGIAPANDAHARSRSVTMQSGNPSLPRPPGLAYHQHPTEDRILSGTPPAYYQSGASPRQPSGQYPRYRMGATLGNRTVSAAASSSSSTPSSSAMPPTSANFNRRLPPLPPPVPQIAEEDECPVCHRALPPRTLPNFESLREAHITICITAHSTYSGTVPSMSGGSPLPPVPPRRTGMFPYTATEKDCVDSAECTICLEEFEVGVPMARLECLCRFHKACIGAWWERHPGRCPMHQHDGFGY